MTIKGNQKCEIPNYFWSFLTPYLNIKEWKVMCALLCSAYFVLERDHVYVGGKQEDGLFYRFVPVTWAATVTKLARQEEKRVRGSKVRSAAATGNKQQQTRRACGHSARERRQQSPRTTVFPHDPFSPPTVWLHKRVLGWQFDSIIPRIRSTSLVIQSAAVFVS